MKFKKILSIVFALLISAPSAIALNGADLNSVTNGTVGFDAATKTTTVTTSAVNSAVTDVNWNKLNVGTGETLTNSFSGLNQTIIHRVTGLDLSNIAGTINSAGLGAATGKVVLINPNGVLFNGATVNVNSLLVSTLALNATPTADLIKVLNGSNKDIQIYNSNITTQNGASFVTNGNIDVRNSNITTDYGHVQLITADGVDFKFVQSRAQKVNDKEDYISPSTNSAVSANNKTKASQITVSKSTLKSANGDVLVNTNSELAADSNVIVYANSAVQAPNGTIYITAINTSFRKDPRYLANLINPKNPAPDYYSSAKVYTDIVAAKDINIAGTSKTAVNNLVATGNVSLGGKNIKANSINALGSIYISGNYNIAVTPKSGTTYFGKKDNTITDTPPAALPDVPSVAFNTDWIFPVSSSNETLKPEKYLPQIDNTQALAIKPQTQMAGAAAKIRRKQNPEKFVGHLDSGSKSIKYYEILK